MRWRLKSPAGSDRWIPAQMVSNAGNVSIWWRYHDAVEISRDLKVRQLIEAEWRMHTSANKAVISLCNELSPVRCNANTLLIELFGKMFPWKLPTIRKLIWKCLFCRPHGENGWLLHKLFRQMFEADKFCWNMVILLNTDIFIWNLNMY